MQYINIQKLMKKWIGFIFKINYFTYEDYFEVSSHGGLLA